MNRIEFLKTCSLTCVGATAFGALLQGCSTTNHFAEFTETSGRISIKKSEFIASLNGEAAQRKFVLAKAVQYDFPICIYKTGEENYSALLMECTHKGCELQPQGDYLICPCHGSEFSNKGIVQNPPAEEKLKTFPITTDNEHIYIRL